MQTTMYYLTFVAAFAVLIVLMMGLATMLRGRSPNLSQTLMRWRIALQFLAIVLVMITVYIMRGA